MPDRVKGSSLAIAASVLTSQVPSTNDEFTAQFDRIDDRPNDPRRVASAIL